MADTQDMQQAEIQDPSTDLDTLVESVQTSLTDGEGQHDNAAEDNQDTLEPTEDTTEQKPVETPEQIAQKREMGKLQQVQKEYNELKKRYETVENWVKSDPDMYKRGLIETSGYTPEQADAYISQLKNEGLWNYKTDAPKVDANAQPIDLDTIRREAVQAVRSEFRQEELNKEAAVALETLNKMFPETTKDAVNSLEESTRKEMLEKIKRTDVLAEAYMSVNPSLDFPSAVVQAYAFVSGKSSEEVQKAREQGMLQGMAKTSLKQSGAAPTIAGTTPRDTVQLSDAQRNIARQMGIKEEDYAKYANENITVLD